MIVHQVFAQIVGEDIKNIMVCDNYELANQLSRMVYGNEASAEECTQYPVSIGDKFIDRAFYFKDGVTPAPRRNTAEEDAQEAQVKVIAAKEELSITRSTLDNVLTELIPSILELFE